MKTYQQKERQRVSEIINSLLLVEDEILEHLWENEPALMRAVVVKLENSLRSGLGIFELIAKEIEEFSWTLPVYTTAAENEASDDAACAVLEQLAAHFRRKK